MGKMPLLFKAKGKKAEVRITSWLEFWDENPGNQDLFRGIAGTFYNNLLKFFPFAPDMRVLDFGCGHGYLAVKLAKVIKEVYIYDASSTMLSRARHNTQGADNVIVLDVFEPALIKPLDYILANSVIQYINPTDLAIYFRSWHEILKNNGRVIISDILMKKLKFFSEIGELLRLSYSAGYLKAQLGQLACLAFSGFPQITKECPLNIYTKDTLSDLAGKTDFSMRILEENLVFGRQRYSVCLTKEKNRT